MPELPEVETIKNQLNTRLKDAKILDVTYSKVVSSIIKIDFPHLVGITITHFERYSKVLLIHLDNGHVIQSGLGMSGSWRLWDKKEDVPHTHMLIKCRVAPAQSLYLAYVDPRRFGKMHFLSNTQWNDKKKSMGLDVSDSSFNERYLETCLKKYPDRKIKPFLLDQKFFGGIGNYIACEVCARAGIKPQRRCKNIRRYEYKKIIQATKSVLDGQIKRKGMTFSGGYTDTTGSKGEGLNDLVVFHQEVCGLCGERSIKKIIMAQRGTYYCPKCQS